MPYDNLAISNPKKNFKESRYLTLSASSRNILTNLSHLEHCLIMIYNKLAMKLKKMPSL